MTPVPFFDYTLYEMCHMFLFWSFVGWCIEVIYMTLETGEYQNRGFLNMPLCPIYGAGVLMVVTFFRPLSDTLFPLYLVSVALCTVFELSVGLGMERLFHNRWWDYSHEKFNFKGYICLKISLLWGLGCVIVVKIIQPMVERYIEALPLVLGLIIISLMGVLIAVDLSASVRAVRNLNNILRQIDEASRLMLGSAVRIGGGLAHETVELKEKYEKLIETRDAAAAEMKSKYDKLVESRNAAAAEMKTKLTDARGAALSEIKSRYEKLLNTRDRAVDRLIKAFPGIQSVSYAESMEKLKSALSERGVKKRGRARADPGGQGGEEVREAAYIIEERSDIDE